MPKLPGISHSEAIRAFSKAGFVIIRQGKHVILSNGQRKLLVPRANPINAITMGGLVRDAGLTLDEFKKLL